MPLRRGHRSATLSLPPVGNSLCGRRVKACPLVGIKSNTQFRRAPKSSPPRAVGARQGVLRSRSSQAWLLSRVKSIGFLPTRSTPHDAERAKNSWQTVSLVIDEWLRLEYACAFAANPDSLVRGGVEVAAGCRRSVCVLLLGIEIPLAGAGFVHDWLEE